MNLINYSSITGSQCPTRNKILWIEKLPLLSEADQYNCVIDGNVTNARRTR